MANTNAPFGFRQLNSVLGAAPNYPQIKATIAWDYGTKIFTGDPVKMTGTGGQIAQWTGATEVSQLWGIFRGCRYLSVSQGKVVYSQFWPATDAAASGQKSIEAYLDPCVLAGPAYFVVQSGAAGCSVDNIGANVDVVLGTGNTLSGQSGAYLDSTYDTAATKPFRVVGLYGQGEFAQYNVGPGTQTGAYNWVVVAANVTGTTGI